MLVSHDALQRHEELGAFANDSDPTSGAHQTIAVIIVFQRL